MNDCSWLYIILVISFTALQLFGRLYLYKKDSENKLLYTYVIASYNISLYTWKK